MKIIAPLAIALTLGMSATAASARDTHATSERPAATGAGEATATTHDKAKSDATAGAAGTSHRVQLASDARAASKFMTEADWWAQPGAHDTTDVT